MTHGKFIDLLLDYTKHSSTELAELLLNKASESVDNDGAKGVGYIYSANYGQTREIEKTYFGNEWNSHTSGANQATIVMAVESELGKSFQKLQGKVHILPITTMNAYTDPIDDWDDKLHLGILNQDLDRVENYLKCGWDVLGIQDPHSDSKKPYAIGGKIANMSPSVSEFIQNFLIRLKNENGQTST